MSSEQDDPGPPAAHQQQQPQRQAALSQNQNQRQQHQDHDTDMPDQPQPSHQAQTGPEPEPDADADTDPPQAQAGAQEEEEDKGPEQEKAPSPGPRAARLQALFATTARHTLDKISRDNFAACFPTIAVRAPGTLEFVQRQMVERLGGLWKKEFDTILANRQVVARLNELETLVGDAAARRKEAGEAAEPPVAPHTLPAGVILAAHLHPHLASQRSQLNAKLQNTQAANARLWDEITAQRAEMEVLLASVEKVLRDVDGANAVLAEVVDELADETRAAERDVRAVSGSGRGR